LLLTVAKDAEKRPKQQLSGDGSGAIIKSLLDEMYIEHDCYALFDRLMNYMKSYFAVAKPPTSGGRMHKGTIPETPIVIRCQNLQEKLLKSIDRVLYRHLENEEVQPTLYLLRWVRLLFAREFHIRDVMLIWDIVLANAVFKQGQMELPLVDYMCVAMCQYVRKDLLEGDNSMCLRRLLSFPPVGDMPSLILRALKLQRGGGIGSSSLPKPKPPPPSSNPTTTLLRRKKQQQRGGITSSPSSSSSTSSSNITNAIFSNLKSHAATLGAGLQGAYNHTTSSSSSSSLEVKKLRKKVRILEHELKQVAKMGEILNNIVNTMQGQFSEGKESDTSVILRSLAELKSVKDVLIGRIKADHVLAYLLPEKQESIIIPEDPLSVMQSPVPDRVAKEQHKEEEEEEEEEQHGGGEDGNEGLVVDDEKKAIASSSSSPPSSSSSHADASATAKSTDAAGAAGCGEAGEAEKLSTTNDDAIIMPSSFSSSPTVADLGGNPGIDGGEGDVPLSSAAGIEQSPPPLFVARAAATAAASATEGKAELMKKHEALLDDLLGDDDDEDEKLRSRNRPSPSDIADASLFGNEGGLGFEDGDNDPFGK